MTATLSLPRPAHRPPRAIPATDPLIIYLSVPRQQAILERHGVQAPIIEAESSPLWAMFPEVADMLAELHAGTAPGPLLAAADITFRLTVGLGWNVLCGLCKRQCGSGHTMRADQLDRQKLDGSRRVALDHLARHHDMLPADLVGSTVAA